jgi:hypothetical protein
MNLHGSISELQHAVVQLYHKLEQRFIENKMISELWGAMAHDISHHISSLDALAPSFWNRLKQEADGLTETLTSGHRAHISDEAMDRSLTECLELSLLIEEPIILKTYVPIIRSLRENQANQSLDFYIMVKAHLARITRVTQAYSGDPLIIKKSNLLLQNFEKEVQEPQITVVLKTVNSVHHIVPKPRSEKQELKPSRTASKRKAHPLAKRALNRPGRVKPLVDKVDMRGRRARR